MGADSRASAATALDRVRDAFTDAGLTFEEQPGGRASAQAPGHSPRDRSVSVRAIEGAVLVHSHSDPTETVLEALGLTTADLFDNRRGADYRYNDGRVVHRTPDKQFRQSGTKPGATACLFRLDRFAGAHTVYVAEGEKDVLALESAGVVATCSPMGAKKANLADWTPLRGKHTVIVRDRDAPGELHAAQVADLLSGVAKSVTIVEAATGKDAADHLMAGHAVAEFVEVHRVRPDREVVAVPAGKVKTKRVRWLFRMWLVLGGLNLLAGREGLGKSTLAVWFAAQVSRGALDGELYGRPRSVLYCCTEDDPATTVKPRLIAAGADLDRVLFLQVNMGDDDGAGAVSLPGDLAAVERLIAEHDVALLVLDAATSTMDSRLDGHDDRKVRQYLEPLARSAARLDYCALGIVHLGKREGSDTGKLILGSIAWSQVARSVLTVAKSDETDRLIVTATKQNLAPESPSAAIELSSAPINTDDGETTYVGLVSWRGETTEDARDLLAGSEDEDRTGVDLWLHDYLEENHPAPSQDVRNAAAKAGYSASTVKRASKRLGVVYTHIGFPRLTHWSLPPLDNRNVDR
jgi:hypothetical protein